MFPCAAPATIATIEYRDRDDLFAGLVHPDQHKPEILIHRRPATIATVCTFY
jgi:hypothetical protein